MLTVRLDDAFGNAVAPADPATLFTVSVTETDGTQPDDWQEELLSGTDPYSATAAMNSPGSAELRFVANISGVYEVHTPCLCCPDHGMGPYLSRPRCCTAFTTVRCCASQHTRSCTGSGHRGVQQGAVPGLAPWHGFPHRVRGVQVSVRIGGVPLQGSPVTLSVVPGALCAKASIPSLLPAPFQDCDVLTSPVGTGLVFDIPLRDCLGNPTVLSDAQVCPQRLSHHQATALPALCCRCRRRTGEPAARLARTCA